MGLSKDQKISLAGMGAGYVVVGLYLRWLWKSAEKESGFKAEYERISKENMSAFLKSLDFKQVILKPVKGYPTKEMVYERFLKKVKDGEIVIRIYTSVVLLGRDKGFGRKAGKDAIRVQAVHRPSSPDATNPNGYILTPAKRVHRVTNWRKNLLKRIEWVEDSNTKVVQDSAGNPMMLRRSRSGKYFWGSRNYPKSKETRPYRG